jgi:hypothetical protein
MYPTYLILTKAKWEGKLPAKLKTADRLSWNEFTYKDVSKKAKRMVNKYDFYPSDDNTKSEIKAYMDDSDVDYSSGDSKSKLLEKLMETPHSTPQIEEEYTYTESVVDTTTLQNPSFKECTFQHGKMGAPRWNNDASKVMIKYELAIADGTLDAVKGTNGITALSHSEAIAEMKEDEWNSAS